MFRSSGITAASHGAYGRTVERIQLGWGDIHIIWTERLEEQVQAVHTHGPVQNENVEKRRARRAHMGANLLDEIVDFLRFIERPTRGGPKDRLSTGQ